ncbi:YgfZ/GcvT domain-containing protein [Paracoccus aerodenitrificans]|uniref:CAF17-like 4Fe-4S cluster assembly/insertion protein YgfZ n=1 Tax=Paracoccus aerodenitrificans TaxID=3017781 RepID=UPI0022F0CE9C|nr:folate-binding protein [Paracoccus aerodenitrificans]WBU65094.1 folate-binding protein [Paracoccus aerodenitrificans]
MTDRRLLRLTGPEKEDFLQGLVTNDITHAPAYAALLTPQGKYLADFFVIPDGDGILLDVAAVQADDLKKRLSMYKLRAKVEINDDPRQVTRGTGAAPDGAIADPRDPALGWRAYGVGSDDDTDWDAIRVAHLVPEAGAELIPNDSYILEHDFERLKGVDFRKGCYVGQEVTARMKHKTTLKKGLRRVVLDGEVPSGTPILMADGREAGVVHTQSGGRGIAYLRFDRVAEGMTADGVSVRVE